MLTHILLVIQIDSSFEILFLVFFYLEIFDTFALVWFIHKLGQIFIMNLILPFKYVLNCFCLPIHHLVVEDLRLLTCWTNYLAMFRSWSRLLVEFNALLTQRMTTRQKARTPPRSHQKFTSVTIFKRLHFLQKLSN